MSKEGELEAAKVLDALERIAAFLQEVVNANDKTLYARLTQEATTGVGSPPQIAAANSVNSAVAKLTIIESAANRLRQSLGVEMSTIQGFLTTESTAHIETPRDLDEDS